GLERVGTGFPIVQLARTMGWRPLPLTVKEAKQFLPALLVDQSNMTQSGSTGQTGDIVLEVKNVDFAYNGRSTLKNIALTVRAGETVALIGRNGAGKSTLLKCIVGLVHTKSGNIRVSGRSIDGRSVADICREVAYLPQNPDDLLFAESVTDELKVTLINHGLTQASGDIHEFLRVLGLAEAAEAYPRDLSVGQRQRVAMGAVTVTRPRLMLLDEPTRGLDASLKAELIALWRKWLADGVAILLVTHDVELAAQIAGRTVMMSQGEVIASGPTREVLGSTPNFAPQISRLLPGRGLLTAADALAYLMN
ncbi:MAG TPA: ABC transporter ATP-binding protein, partial [Promineifilum sp.]|nr:ABC transporter ATP-binding protein [Promineifilum sp.]